jgi:anhydro-N-acetylmuramic acid kinase
MVIDAVSFALTGKPVDEGGACAASGKINSALLKKMLEYDGDYLDRKPPKSTGRERYNADYVKKVLSWRAEDGISINDTLSTVTYYTAETVARGIKTFCLPCPKELFISGGGLHNKTLVSFIKELLPGCDVKPGDELGMPADAKEAAAFAVLANEAIHGLCNNAPAATGARHPVVMGKITF